MHGVTAPNSPARAALQIPPSEAMLASKDPRRRAGKRNRQACGKRVSIADNRLASLPLLAASLRGLGPAAGLEPSKHRKCRDKVRRNAAAAGV